MRVPFIVYADFESFTPQLSTCQPNSDKSYTKRYQKYVMAISYALKQKCLLNSIDLHAVVYNIICTMLFDDVKTSLVKKTIKK